MRPEYVYVYAIVSVFQACDQNGGLLAGPTTIEVVVVVVVVVVLVVLVKVVIVWS